MTPTTTPDSATPAVFGPTPPGATAPYGAGANPCGEPGMLRQAADAWRSMSNRLSQARDELSACSGRLAGQWQGASAQGFRGWSDQTIGQCGQDTDRANQVPTMLETMAGQAEHGNEQVHTAQTMGLAGPCTPGSGPAGAGGPAGPPGARPFGPTAPGSPNGTAAGMANDPMGVLQPILAQLGQALAALTQALQALQGGAAPPDGGTARPTEGQPALHQTAPVGDCGTDGPDGTDGMDGTDGPDGTDNKHDSEGDDHSDDGDNDSDGERGYGYRPDGGASLGGLGGT